MGYQKSKKKLKNIFGGILVCKTVLWTELVWDTLYYGKADYVYMLSLANTLCKSLFRFQWSALHRQIRPFQLSRARLVCFANQQSFRAFLCFSAYFSFQSRSHSHLQSFLCVLCLVLQVCCFRSSESANWGCEFIDNLVSVQNRCRFTNKKLRVIYIEYFFKLSPAPLRLLSFLLEFYIRSVF